MASLFAPPSTALTTVFQTLYVCPNGFRQQVQVNVPNIDPSNDCDFTWQWTDAAPSVVTTGLGTFTVKKKDGFLSAIKNLEPGDLIQGRASADGDLIAHIEVLVSEPA